LSNDRLASDLLESVGFLNAVKIVLDFLTEGEPSTDRLDTFSKGFRPDDNFLESLKRVSLSEDLLESGIILIESLAGEKGSADILDCLSGVSRPAETLLELVTDSTPLSYLLESLSGSSRCSETLLENIACAEFSVDLDSLCLSADILIEFTTDAKRSANLLGSFSDVSLSTEIFPENLEDFRRSAGFLEPVIGASRLAESCPEPLIDNKRSVDLESFSEVSRLVETPLESLSAIIFSAYGLLECLRISARSAEVLMILCRAVDSSTWLYL
jgi:hypothetical protein